MEINNLLPQTQKTSTDTKKYFAIEIGPESIKTATWEVAGVKPQLITMGTIEEYSSDSPDDLIAAVDTSLTKASHDVEPEPNEVVFSLPDSWVSEENINSDKKALLKKLTEKLDLKPIGFVVTTEAIVHYLKTKQGGPFTGILVGVSDQEVKVTIVKNADLLASHSVGRSDDLGADVQEALSRPPSVDPLPSSMLLYDGHTDLETEKQQLISYNWQDKLPFLHIPKIDSFDPDETIKAVVTAGGTEVIGALKVSGASTAQIDEPESEPEADEDQALEINDPTASSTDDIPNLAEEFGFSDKFQGDHPPPQDIPSSIPDQPFLGDRPSPVSAGPLRRFSAPKFNLAALFGRLKFPAFSPSFPRRSPPLLIIGLVFLALIGLGLGVAYWYLPSAEVTVYVTPRVISRELTFTLDPSLDEPDLGSSTIPGRVRDAQVEGDAQADVSGEKLVGDQAKGKVTLFNRTDSVKSFPAGTKLTGPDSLAYTLDEDVQIASASSKENPDFSITTEPATAQVNITASTIGAEFNLGSGTEFAVSNLAKSSFVARAKSDISGGTSRQITAVSQEDLDNLSLQLKQDLQGQIANQFSQSPEDFLGAVILEGEETQLQEDFSKDVGDEANSLSLHATLKAKAMTYNRSDLDIIIQQAVLSEISDTFTYAQDKSTIEVIETHSDGGKIQVTAQAKARLIPNLDTNDIARQIRGRYPEVTESYFQSLPNYAKVAIDLNPKVLPKRLRTFPRIMSKINITVEVQDED